MFPIRLHRLPRLSHPGSPAAANAEVGRRRAPRLFSPALRRRPRPWSHLAPAHAAVTAHKAPKQATQQAMQPEEDLS
jgi:hypothetical protein